MKVPITEFRRNIFDFTEKAIQGEPVEFTYKGHVIKLSPEQKTSKLSRLIPEQVINPAYPDLRASKRESLAEIEAEWKKDWDEI